MQNKIIIVDCWRCNGKGYIVEYVNTFMWDKVACKYCNGIGKLKVDTDDIKHYKAENTKN